MIRPLFNLAFLLQAPPRRETWAPVALTTAACVSFVLIRPAIITFLIFLPHQKHLAAREFAGGPSISATKI